MGAGGLGRFKWSGTVPGADTEQYSIWSSTATQVADDATHNDNVANNANRDGACGANLFQLTHTDKAVFSVKNSQAFTLNEYYLPDRNTGTTWIQISSVSCPIPASGFTTEREFLVETYPDWRLEVVNQGVAQATWSPTLSFVDQRAIP